ncbi:FAD-dependent oxidoreductase [Bradyrhizobium tropiciagri]|uniref:FAD-dependent oxidoreductase n=1 Tax=Bradyrhizobium tropiciagri TaxID=312253 RepID=UPI00067AB44C|nr:FAD-dependent oxidoreductase [Bradyrhizobium tropiciagri]
MRTSTPNFTHVVHPVSVPPLSGGHDVTNWKIAIAGGGPVGLATALALARRGIRVLVIEADETVCVGSRAICLSRRSLEIIDRLGGLKPFEDKGLAWTNGRSFYGTDEVLNFSMPHDRDQRLAPMTNLQQYYIEQFLLDAAQKYAGFIEIRWGTRFDELKMSEEGVELTLSAKGTSYAVNADYLVACDGARSRARQALGLRMNGTSYEGRYVIVDIEIDLDLPTERLAWFDPPSNPGRTMLMHRQPDNVWRLDYQLRADEDQDEMLRDENVVPIVKAHLAMLGIDRPWKLIWSSVYRAAAVSLDQYRTGRVVFAGDAAHLVPIFGVRGLNSGFEDAFNLGWKLAAVVRGIAPTSILDTYTQERRMAWETNVANAMKSTEFMAPPSHGYELMRDAALSLARRHEGIATLINPRQASASTYQGSALNCVTRDEGEFIGGPQLGAATLECPVQVDGEHRHLTQLLGDDFTLIWTGRGALAATVGEEVDAAGKIGLAVRVVEIEGAADHSSASGSTATSDRFIALYDAAPRAAYLFRPDGHICARWRAMKPGDLTSAIGVALARARAAQ